MSVNGYKFTAISGGAAGAMDAQDGAALLDGDIAIVTASGTLSVFQLDADSGAVENGTSVVAPDTNAGDKRWLIQQVASQFTMPVGSVIPYTSGYFTTNANGSFTDVLGDSDAEINALINPLGWYLCNGAALNLPGSPIFDGAGRYLPKMDDNRIPMGAATIGTAGGSSTHLHTTGSLALTEAQMPIHDHPEQVYSGGTGGSSSLSGPGPTNSDATLLGAAKNTGTAGSGAVHNHGNTGSGSSFQPYLTMKYIIRAI